MRDAITTVYSGPKWKRKVANMDDNQVIAVYHKFLREGKFDEDYDDEPTYRKEKKTKGSRKEAPHFEPYTGEQLSLFK
jgi:hypothetical protein